MYWTVQLAYATLAEGTGLLFLKPMKARPRDILALFTSSQAQVGPLDARGAGGLQRLRETVQGPRGWGDGVIVTVEAPR